MQEVHESIKDRIAFSLLALFRFEGFLECHKRRSLTLSPSTTLRLQPFPSSSCAGPNVERRTCAERTKSVRSEGHLLRVRCATDGCSAALQPAPGDSRALLTASIFWSHAPPQRPPRAAPQGQHTRKGCTWKPSARRAALSPDASRRRLIRCFVLLHILPNLFPPAHASEAAHGSTRLAAQLHKEPRACARVRATAQETLVAKTTSTSDP